MNAFINAEKLALGALMNKLTHCQEERNPLPKQENVSSYMKQWTMIQNTCKISESSRR